LGVDQSPHGQQGGQSDPRGMGIHQTGAVLRIQHPTGKSATGAVRQDHDYAGCLAVRERPQHRHILPEERMMPVADSLNRLDMSSLSVARR